MLLLPVSSTIIRRRQSLQTTLSGCQRLCLSVSMLLSVCVCVCVCVCVPEVKVTPRQFGLKEIKMENCFAISQLDSVFCINTCDNQLALAVVTLPIDASKSVLGLTDIGR